MRFNPFWKINNVASAIDATANAASQARTVLDDEMPGYTSLLIEDTLTPTKIKSAMDNYRREGKLQGLSNVLDLLMDSDDNLQSKVLVRKSPLKSALWAYGSELPKPKQEFYDLLIKQNLGNWVETFIEGKLYGWQFQQIMYELKDGLLLPKELVSYSNLDLRISNRKLALWDKNAAMILPDYKFINILYRRPTLHAILKYYVFYAYAINHWAQFVETYGKPPRIGKYESNALPAEVEVLKRAVKALGTDQAAIISKNTEIEFKDFGGKYGSQSLYRTLCDFVTSRVTNAILGQTLTTQEGDTGSYAQAKVHEEVQDYIVDADLEDLGVYVNTILGYADALNWGGSGIDVAFKRYVPVNLQQQIIIDTAVVNLGVDVPKSYFYDTYNLPVPKKGEEVVTAAPRETAAQSETCGSESAARCESGAVRASCESGAVRANAVGVDGIAKSLAKMQAQIRACKNLKELKAIDYEWFVQDVGADLAAQAVQAYVDGRKAKRSKSRSNSGLPEIRWEWDDGGIQAANAFRNQAHIISAVRTGAAFKQLWEDAAAVLEEGGDFAEFLAKATLSGFAPENPYHLKTEYETSQAAGEMAGRWDEIAADADLFPYLRYVTMQDELVRDEHVVLDGTVARVDDDFWTQNYPPNGYNCRCYVEQLTEDEAKADPKWDAAKPTLTKDAQFAGNVGQSKTIPSDTYDKLWEYAQKVIDQLPNRESGAAVICAAKLPKGVILDAKNYPVALGDYSENDQVKLTIGQPGEIWHNELRLSSYIRRFEDKVMVAEVRRGVVSNVQEYENYDNQGRSGVREN